MSMVSSIGITTADRPELLERCLWSLTRQITPPAAAARVIVVDASKSARNESQGRSATSSVQRSTGLNIAFVGRQERLAVRRQLRAIGSDSLLEFAFRPGASGNRNLILLLTGGEHVLFVDDDIVCDVWRSPSLRRMISLGGHTEQRSIAFYRRREDVCSGLVPASVDLLTAHEVALGRSVKSLATSDRFAVTSRHACQHIRDAAAGRRPSIVRMTLTGIAGDSGANYPDRLLFSRGTWRAVLESDPAVFKTAFGFREVRKIANRYIVMHRVSCMAACLGVDNTSLLPPFVPTGRNEDGLFGATLFAIDGRTVSCYIPYVVVHASNRKPRYSIRQFPSASETRSAELLIALIQSSSSHLRVDDPDRRLMDVGKALGELAALPPQDFVGVTTLATLRARERELQVMDSILDDTTYPAYWHRDIRSYRQVLLKNIHKSSFFLPLEFRHRGGITAGYKTFQQFVQLAGELYREWPTLWAKARTALTRAGSLEIE